MIFKIESLGLMISTTLATIMWLSARANYKMQERMLFNIETQHKQQENINDGEKIKKHKKSIIFEEEGQVAVTKEKRSSLSLDGNSETEKENVSISIDTINNESDSSLKSISYNIEKLGAIKHLQILSDHLKKLFKNPIFIIIVIVGFSYDGTIVCFTGILKRLLIDKFKRAESNIAFEMGFTKYCGFAAPFAGYLIDRIRNREWFMFIAGLCLVFSTFTLFLCKYDNIILLYISLFGISIGQVCYGNSFWPSIASIAGRKYQIVAYGFMGCITSIGAVIIPQIYAQVVDYFGNIVIACFIFAILTSIGLTASIIIIIINNTCYAEIDYINRHLSTPKKLTINDQDGEKEQSK